MMLTTTTTCLVCNDRGSIWKEIYPGAWSNSLCNCRTPEEWARLSDEQTVQLLKMYGGDTGGEMEHTRRQEHQLF